MLARRSAGWVLPAPPVGSWTAGSTFLPSQCLAVAIPAAGLAIHLCIGQVYAFSVFKIPLMSRFDVGEVSVGWIFSVAIAMLGLSAAFGGTWVEKAGPRKSMIVAGTAWVLGFFVAAVGIATGQL